VVNNKTYLYPQNPTFGLGTIKLAIESPREDYKLLFHEHPSKCVAESVSLVVDLIGCSRQVRLCAWHLGVELSVCCEILDGAKCCAHDANLWRRVGHVDSGVKNEITQLCPPENNNFIVRGVGRSFAYRPLSAFFNTRI
jgi:hypothetical protein